MTDTLIRGTAPSPAPGRTPLPWLRKHRALTAHCAVVAGALGLAAGGQRAPRGDAVPLSPGNAGPDGARAVTQILGRHGVDVHTAGTFEEAMAALGESSAATLLLYDRNGILDEPRLRDLAAAAGEVVVVTPRLETLTALGSGIRQAGVVPDDAPPLAPGCPLPDALAAGEVSGSQGFVYDGGVSCYRPAGSAAGLLAVSGDGQLTVLGSTVVHSSGLVSSST